MLRSSRVGRSLIVAAALTAAAACTSSPTVTTSPTPPGSSPVALVSAPAATPTGGASPSAVTTSLDPCQLVTAQEASSLAGASFGPGREETDSGGGKICVYGYQTLNVFIVLVALAPDAATAQADWALEESRAQAKLGQLTGYGSGTNIKLNDVSNLPRADRAAVGSGSAVLSGRTIGISAIYVVKGATFFTFSDLVLGHAGPSISAMESQAQTVLTRLR